MSELFFPTGIIDGPRRVPFGSLFFLRFFFISLLFRRWRCNQIARPIPRTGRIYEDGLVELEIRRSRFLLRIIATLRWKNRLSDDISSRSPRFLFPVPILWDHCNYLFVRIIKWGTAEKKSKFSFIIATREIDQRAIGRGLIKYGN